MSKETREFISCLMDGEIDQESSRFLMRRLATDDEMQATWSRYHLVRDCLRFQEGTMADIGLTSRVSVALEQETTVQRRWTGASRWLKPVSGAAVAASVALMAIVAVGPASDEMQSGVPVEMASSVVGDSFTSPQGVLSRGPKSSEASLMGQSQSREERQRMNSYLLRHYQAAGSNGSHGVVTAAPIILISSQSPAVDREQEDVDKAAGER